MAVSNGGNEEAPAGEPGREPAGRRFLRWLASRLGAILIVVSLPLGLIIAGGALSKDGIVAAVFVLILFALPVALGMWLARVGSPGIWRRPVTLRDAWRLPGTAGVAIGLMSIVLILTFPAAGFPIAFAALCLYPIVDAPRTVARSSWLGAALVSTLVWVVVFAAVTSTSNGPAPGRGLDDLPGAVHDVPARLRVGLVGSKAGCTAGRAKRPRASRPPGAAACTLLVGVPVTMNMIPAVLEKVTGIPRQHVYSADGVVVLAAGTRGRPPGEPTSLHSPPVPGSASRDRAGAASKVPPAPRGSSPGNASTWTTVPRRRGPARPRLHLGRSARRRPEVVAPVPTKVTDSRPRPGWRRELAVLLLFLAVGVVLTRPLAQRMRTATLAKPDAAIYVWEVNWLSGHLLRPDELFEGNIFVPTRHAALFSDLALGTALLVAPLRPLVRDPVALYNAGLLVTLAFGSWGFHRLAFALTGSVAAGLLTGLLAAFGSHQLLHVYQLGLINIGFLALFLAALHRPLAEPRRWTNAVLVGVAFALNGLSSVYFGVAASVLALVFAAGRCRGFRSRECWLACAGAVAVAGLLMAPYIRAFMWLQETEGLQRPLHASVQQAFHPAPDLQSDAYLYRRVIGNEGQRLFPGVACLSSPSRPAGGGCAPGASTSGSARTRPAVAGPRAGVAGAKVSCPTRRSSASGPSTP